MMVCLHAHVYIHMHVHAYYKVFNLMPSTHVLSCLVFSSSRCRGICLSVHVCMHDDRDHLVGVGMVMTMGMVLLLAAMRTLFVQKLLRGRKIQYRFLIDF